MLTRVNATIAPVQIALSNAGIPIASGVGSEFVERVGIRSALAWLRIAIGRTLRSDDLAEATRRPSRGFSPRVREWVTEQSTTERLMRLAGRLSDKDSARVSDFVAEIERMGWTAALATPLLIQHLTPLQLALIAGGGVAYTLGVPILLLRRPDPWPTKFGYHEIWHGFTVLAAALHFGAVALVVRG